MEVTSEILPFFERDQDSKPAISNKNVVSKFIFSCPVDTEMMNADLPGQTLEKDDDGDYLVKRRHDSSPSKEVVVILEHGVSTELNLVGLQIWRGALLLSDYLIHIRNSIKNKTVLELGTGVGLTSVIAGLYAKQVICTDVDRGDILKLLKCNIKRNGEIMKSTIMVCGLDFFEKTWSAELEEKLQEVTVVLAADVIYDNDVTEAFIETITKILSIPPKKTLLMAMEKRYVFTLADLDSVAPCYEYLITCLESAKRKKPFCDWKVEEIPVNFPQFFNYERVKELVMFRITS